MRPQTVKIARLMSKVSDYLDTAKTIAPSGGGGGTFSDLPILPHAPTPRDMWYPKMHSALKPGSPIRLYHTKGNDIAHNWEWLRRAGDDAFAKNRAMMERAQAGRAGTTARNTTRNIGVGATGLGAALTGAKTLLGSNAGTAFSTMPLTSTAAVAGAGAAGAGAGHLIDKYVGPQVTPGGGSLSDWWGQQMGNAWSNFRGYGPNRNFVR